VRGSEFNNTAAQLGYTLYNSIHVDVLEIQENTPIKNTQKHKLNTTHKKHTTQNTAKQNNPGLAAYYDTQPGNKVGLYTGLQSYWLSQPHNNYP